MLEKIVDSNIRMLEVIVDSIVRMLERFHFSRGMHEGIEHSNFERNASRDRRFQRLNAREDCRFQCSNAREELG